MKNQFYTLLLFAGLCAAMVACCPKPDIKKERDEASAVVSNFLKAFATEDLNLFSEVMAHDEAMVNFGTDISETTIGWNAYRESHIAQWEAMDSASMDSENTAVFMGEAGNTAWFSSTANWTLVMQQDTVRLTNLRMTGVLEKRRQGWKIVQIHASIPQGQAFAY